MTRDIDMEAVDACVKNINDHTDNCGIYLTARPYLTTLVEIINDCNEGEQRLMFSGTTKQGFWWAKGFLDALGHTGQLIYEPGETNTTEKEIV